MEDIDLLLPQADHASALSSLTTTGWEVVRSGEHDAYDTVLTHPAVPSYALELHFGLESASQRVTTLDPYELWASRQPVNCLGTSAYALPLEEEVVYLAAHAGKPHHAFVRLIWIADLATVIATADEQGSPIDWSKVRRIADAGSCRTVVGAALALASHAGVDTPAGLFPLPRHGKRAATIRQLIDVGWPLDHLEVPGYRLNYALTDNRLLRLRILLVLRASGHGIGKRFWSLIDAPVARWQRGRRARAHELPSS
jgi:putative nucleotidyltransferase-like protein